ncbi:hypothetical protein AeRB84_017500 [Aphanomyces euteiches]|nr:hypothetical protein AeRB84_017500 [Aphanomyces euteiches]
MNSPKPAVVVSFNRWSLAYNILFALNLASTPFMAYLTEPRPGQGVEVPSWNSFDEYVNGTADYLKQIYNNQTMSDASISHRDQATNTYCMRANAMLPFQIPQEETLDYLLGMPASVFHGHGIRSYLELFLTANEKSKTNAAVANMSA